MDITKLYDIYLKHPVICTDTRAIEPDCLFFALGGVNFDGNKFAAEALAKGAAYCIVSDNSLSGEKYIKVERTLETLQELALYHRKHFTIPVIAITGSNGKTTTKELVTTVLKCEYKVHATTGNFNNHIGVPLTLLSMPPDIEIAVVEMGANHIGEIKMLCNIAMPTHGLITNIGKAHLEGFGSVEGVRQAKGELFDYLKETNGYAFVNADDLSTFELGRDIIEKTTYGLKNDHHPAVHFTFEQMDGEEGFILKDTNSDVTIRSSMFGYYNASNMLAAYVVGSHFKVRDEMMIGSLSSYTPGANRSEVVNVAGCTVVKDAYNANPSSMENALKAFADRYPKGWVILGAMKELGEESVNAHQQVIDLITTLGFEKVILIGEEFKAAMQGFDRTPVPDFILADNVDDIKKTWDWDQCKTKAVLLKGSRSMYLERLLDGFSQKQT